jgi:hypothetical protein
VASGIFKLGEIRSNIDEFSLVKEYKNRCDKALATITNIIVRDTDPYVPFNTGATAKSAQTASDFAKGNIVYDTPYAKDIYEDSGRSFSHDHHDKATDHWFEASRRVNEKDWIEQVAKLIGGQAQ